MVHIFALIENLGGSISGSKEKNKMPAIVRATNFSESAYDSICSAHCEQAANDCHDGYDQGNLFFEALPN